MLELLVTLMIATQEYFRLKYKQCAKLEKPTGA